MKPNLRKDEINILLTSLGKDDEGNPESLHYTLEDAKTKALGFLTNVQTTYDLQSPMAIPLLIGIIMELVEQSPVEIDLRALPPLLESQRQRIGHRRRSQYDAWKIGAWSEQIKEYEKTGEVRIKLTGALSGCTLVPIAISGLDSHVLSDWVCFPLPDQPGMVRSCPKKHFQEVQDWNRIMEENHKKNPHSLIQIGYVQGGIWNCGIFQGLERQPNSLSVWVERNLRNQVKTYLALPKVVVMQHWDFETVQGLEPFTKGFKCILSDEIRESFKAES